MLLSISSFPLLTSTIRLQNDPRRGIQRQRFHALQLATQGEWNGFTGLSEHRREPGLETHSLGSICTSDNSLSWFPVVGPQPRIMHCFQNWDSWDICHWVRSSESHPRKGFHPPGQFQTQTSAAARCPQSCTFLMQF